MGETILFADNDKKFIGPIRRHLEAKGYRVVTATSPEEVMHAVERESVDLAILDIRLKNDFDRNDESGLEIARQISQMIPVIILTQLDKVEYARSSLIANVDGRPPAHDFITKDKDRNLSDISAAVERVLRLKARMSEVNEIEQSMNLKEGLRAESIRQWKLNHRIGLGVSVAGIFIVFLGVLMAYFKGTDIGMISTVVGAIVEGTSLLFFVRVDKAGKHAEEIHKDQLQLTKGRNCEDLLLHCSQFEDKERRDECRMMVVKALMATLME